MSESNTVQPTIEDEINTLLCGDSIKTALDFVAFLRANKMAPKCVDAQNSVWCFDYLGKGTSCVIVLKGWFVFWGGWDVEHEEYPIDEKTKEFALAHVNICTNFKTNGKECGCGNQPGISRTIFGKEFDNVCTALLAFTQPEAETLEYVKRLVEMENDSIAGAAKKTESD